MTYLSRIGCLVGVSVLLVSACAPQSDPSTSQDRDAPSAASSSVAPEPGADPVELKPSPGDGSEKVKVDEIIEVAAAKGILSSVEVTGKGTDAKGKSFKDKIPGKVSKDKTSWKASTRLEPGATYTVNMTGENADGAARSTKSTFSTQSLRLDQQTFASVYPLDGETYGVAMPVIVKFDVGVKDKKTFEKHLKVTSSPQQVGSWSWISSTEAHYRPKKYWKPGTKVSLDADLNSLPAGKGIYGQKSRKTSFKIGKSVVTTINLKKHKATVKINDKLARTIPVSGGKSGFTTRSGTKVITEKLARTKMASETIGIAENSAEGYDLDVKYAMRITNSGEFVHAAPWNASKFGVSNGSHGCVGMSTSNAGWLFNKVRVGDPVKVTGTSRGLEQGNGITDWDVSWKKWQKGSAL